MTPRDSCMESLELPLAGRSELPIAESSELPIASQSHVTRLTRFDVPDSAAACLIVCGMHRSGTSLTASLLKSAGVSIGEDLLPPDSWNQRGYFENRAFVDFHSDVLQASGLDRDGWDANVPVGVPAYMIDRARQLVEESQTKPIWGWKDPRTALFLEFWADLVPHSKFIIPFRSPWAVVDSLLRRGDGRFRADPKFAVEVWTNYCRLLMSFSRKHADRCLLFDIEDISRSPQKFIRAVNSRFGMNLSDFDSEIFEVDLFSQSGSIANTQLIVERFSPDAADLWNEVRRLISDDRDSESLVSSSESCLPESSESSLPESASESSLSAETVLLGIVFESWAVAAMLTDEQKRSVATIEMLNDQLVATQETLKSEQDASRKQYLNYVLDKYDARKAADGRFLLDSIAAFLSKFPVLKRLHDYLRGIQSIKLISESGLFDHQWYFQQNPELKGKRINPIAHYVRIGSAQGRDPNPLFENNWYKLQNPDWERIALNPLEHYLLFGARQGTNPNRYFDTQWYLIQNTDVAEAGINALRHYIIRGAIEGREPNPDFDTQDYVSKNPEAKEPGLNPLAHFLRCRSLVPPLRV